MKKDKEINRNKKDRNTILFPAAAFAFICVRLGSIEFQITLQEYKALATSLTIPFLVYYILEIFFSIKIQNRSMLDSRGLGGAVILLLLSIFYLTILPNTSYCTIQFE